ncbi:MAG: carboxypeptidase regulatory-like domain-containing protein [Acidobacteria bacterium]|nr:carboxypeptidase regulatory-like domain-containing protein [Acidobacteriota bacterium]
MSVRKTHSRFTLFSALAILILLVPSAAFAQATTGTLTGSVTAAADGTALPGVTIEAIHTPTSSRYSAVTGGNGRYLIPNVRVGGPYTISASLSGFQTSELTGVMVNLGTATEVSMALQLAVVTEIVSVTATAELIDPAQTGSTSSVSTEEIMSLPTVNRSLQDFARTNPLFNVAPFDSSATSMSVAGRNNRYNTIQIDGSVNNDLFGLAATGTPGGQADTQPISLDAIQELQLVVSPYDVRQSGFTGGGINAVTRSGSNSLEGSLFWNQRDESFVGDGPFDRPIANFSSDQYGGRLGGPIVSDTAFFFLNAEINEREAPTGVSADGTTGNQYQGNVDLVALRDFLIDTYGYDPGGLGDIASITENDLFFGRLDWNAGDNHNFTLRHNYVKGGRDNTGSRGTSVFTFPTAIYTFTSETNSTVAQLNSVFGASVFNEARIGLQTIRDQRAVPIQFPSVEIGGTGPRRGAARVGTERFSGANALDQDILELTNDLTWVRGDHTLVIGTNNEFFEFKNLFMAEALGYYYFPDLDAFRSGIADEYRITFANGADPRRPTQFEASRLGVYVNDIWRMSDNLTVNLGLRADKPNFPDTPSFNPDVPPAIGFSTAVAPSEDVVISPRVGFNWALPGFVQHQLRGGVGVFAGRTPYVWISNAYGNTGVEQTALSCFSASCMPLFNPDPNSQPKDLPAAGGAFSVDLIDPDFEMPRVLRATLGYDRELPWGIRGSAEVILEETQKDVFYENVNRVQTGTSPLDGRPTYSNVSPAIRDAILLTNTNEGDATMYTVQFVRPFTNGVTLSASYANQDATTAFEATSSRAISNFQFHPTRGDLFEQDTYRSSFEVSERVVASGSYTFTTGIFNQTIGLYFDASSGQPYSLLMGGDPNRDRLFSNDLLFVPGSADEVIIQNSSGQVVDYSVLAAFLESAGIDPTAGRILSANESTGPWNQQIDLHYEFGVPLAGTLTNIYLDVMNFANLLDSDWGVMEFVRFQTYTPVTYRGEDPTTGKSIYRESFNGALNPGRQFSTQDTRSRWQLRLGLRVSF